MKNIFITGLGIASEVVTGISHLQKTNIDAFPEYTIPVSENDITLERNREFLYKNLVSREDRSLLNKISKLAIDATAEAFKAAEAKQVFTSESKEGFKIYIGNESSENNLTALDELLFSNEFDVFKCMNKLGDIKPFLNPLDMLRLLSTNVLYHLSKIFSLQGGGYPVRRMSLSGLCALEEGFYQMHGNTPRALVTAAGDNTKIENLCAFMKLGMVKTRENNQGILPSFGAASIILEDEDVLNTNKKIYAQIKHVKSRYKKDTFVSKEEWIKHFIDLNEKSRSKVNHVVLYDNGNSNLLQQELDAVKQVYPQAMILSYKKYIGYTGKANNLIDLIISLSDKRIPCGSNILINGIGTSSGFGSILIEKKNDV